MRQPGTQLNGNRSKRGRLSEGRPTKKTPEMVARISEAISLGLTDEETSALVGIESDPLRLGKTDSEFFGIIKSAVSARLLKRLKQIERGRMAGKAAHGLWNACCLRDTPNLKFRSRSITPGARLTIHA